MSYHITQFYQAFPRVNTASDKHWGEKAWERGYSLATCTLQTAHLSILPLTAILYVVANEQPDVTSRQLNSLALVCNWSIVQKLTLVVEL